MQQKGKKRMSLLLQTRINLEEMATSTTQIAQAISRKGELEHLRSMVTLFHSIGKIQEMNEYLEKIKILEEAGKEESIEKQDENEDVNTGRESTASEELLEIAEIIDITEELDSPLDITNVGETADV